MKLRFTNVAVGAVCYTSTTRRLSRLNRGRKHHLMLIPLGTSAGQCEEVQLRFPFSSAFLLAD
jgi:hypothetical protein